MKRIILTVTTDLVYDQRMQRICSSLQKAGYRVLLVGRKKVDSKPLSEESYSQKRLYCFFQKGKWFYLEYNIRLFFFLLFRKADILNAIDLDTILAVRLAAKFKSCQLVYDAHEYFTEVPEVVDRPRIQALWERIARYCIPAMDACYTVGPGLARIFEEKYQQSFGVVRNLPLADAPHEKRPENQERILFYQGALNAGRGLESIISAMSLLPASFTLWLAGEGDLSNVLRKQVLDAGLQERIRFLGFVLPRELKALTPTVWLGLNLLENKGLSYYFSLANKAFDYVQAGVPSLQMDFPEYRALQEEQPCFILLKNLDPEQIAAEIIRLDREKSRYEQLQQTCHRAAHIWTWEQEEKKLLAIYDKLN